MYYRYVLVYQLCILLNLCDSMESLAENVGMQRLETPDLCAEILVPFEGEREERWAK